MGKFVIALAGNKCDMAPEQWQISQEMISKMKEAQGMGDDII